MTQKALRRILIAILFIISFATFIFLWEVVWIRKIEVNQLPSAVSVPYGALVHIELADA